MTTILIADDHEMIRDGLRRVIEEDPTMSVVGEAATGAEVLSECDRLKPDLVLLDLMMPGRDSLELIDELKSQSPNTRVLMLTALPEEQYALRSLRAGADGFLSKCKAGADLIGAVRRIQQGGRYVSQNVATLLAINVAGNHHGPVHERLSDREFQVLRMIGSGKTVSEIARELELSVKTVSTYRSRILEKTELRNNAEIMRFALQHGIAS